MSTGADACETRLMILILARLMKLEEMGQPCHFWRANTGAAIEARTGRKIQFGERGQADLIGVARSRFVGIETKSASGRVSEDQKTWGAAIAHGGGLYVVARDLETAVDPVLELLGLTGQVRWARDHWEPFAA